MRMMNLRKGSQAAVLAFTLVLSAVGTGLAAPGNGNGGGPSNAPGQTGTSPGQQGTPPGQDKTPPGQAQSNGHGANTTGPYDPNGVGQPSGNGKSTNNNGNRPCAGCVGNADAKNPPGQLPGGSDANRGYECDENQGVGKTNPAHSGCSSTTTTTPPVENPPPGTNPPGNNPPGSNPPGDTSTGPVVLGDRANGVPTDDTSPAVRGQTEASPPSGADDEAGLPLKAFPGRLPFTGGQALTLALLGALVMLAGVGVRRRLGPSGALR